jgi:hypothetical protein
MELSHWNKNIGQPGGGERSGPAGCARLRFGARRMTSGERRGRPGRRGGAARPAGRRTREEGGEVRPAGGAVQPAGRRRGERPGRLGGGRTSPLSGSRAIWVAAGSASSGPDPRFRIAEGPRTRHGERAATMRVHMLLDLQTVARFSFQHSTNRCHGPCVGISWPCI